MVAYASLLVILKHSQEQFIDCKKNNVTTLQAFLVLTFGTNIKTEL